MRLGKLSKNTRRRDPRYFLYEQQDQAEKEFLDLFIKVGNEISDEELLGSLNEAEEPVSLENPQKQELHLSEETKKYIINWTRRRIVNVGSFKIRIILKTATATTFGGVLVALFAAGYGPRKLWRVTSTNYLDKKIEQVLDKLYPRGKEFLYPGETDIKTLIKATFQSVWRSLKSEAEQKVEALPEPDKEELEQLVKKQLEEIGGHPVEIDLSAGKTQVLSSEEAPEEPPSGDVDDELLALKRKMDMPAEDLPEEAPEEAPAGGWEDWDKARVDPDRYKNNPLYRKLVKKVQGGK